MNRAPRRKNAGIALGRPNGKPCALLGPFEHERRQRILPLEISVRFAVILVQLEAPVRAGEDVHVQFGRVGGGRPIRRGSQRDDRPRTRIDRDIFQRAVDIAPAAALQGLAAEEVEPLALRQPQRLVAQAGLGVGRAGEGRGQQLAAEPVCLPAGIGIRLLGVGVIERRDQRQGGGVIAPGHAVNIRDQRMAQAQGGAGGALGGRAAPPGAALVIGVVGAVHAQDGAEDAVLDPARVQLIVFDAAHVPADIVAPPAVAHVGSRGSEARLEVQRLPADHRIARKADRVAMVAQPAPAGEDEGAAFAIPPKVVEVQVVEPPQRVQAGQRRPRALLPIQPPEIYPLRLQRVVQQLEVGAHEVRVGAVEGDGLAFDGGQLIQRGQAHAPGKFRISRLMRPDA